MLNQSEGQMLLDIMDNHGLEQIIPFLTRDKNTLDLIFISLPGQFQDIHSPDKLSDHDIVSGILRIFIPHIKKPRRKAYSYQKGDFETIRKDALRLANEKCFNGHSIARSVQENFNLITYFIHDSADKHIPSNNSECLYDSLDHPRDKKKDSQKEHVHAKAKKTGSGKLKFESLRQKIKTHIKKQHDLYVNNLVGDVKANPRDFYRYINSQKRQAK